MDVCKNCGAGLTHVEGRRKKEFCSNNCRATFWQKNNKKKKTETVVKDLTKPTDVKKPFEQPKSNFAINTTPPTKLQEYEAELLRLGDTPLGKKRRKFVEGEIEKLKNNNTASNH